jgi:hypothetical protein
MRPVTSIREHIESQSVRLMESTIPGDTTIAEWRTHPRRRPAPTEPCGHIHETTTRYDHDRKLLHFLLICPECGTEKVVETQPYEPRFAPHPAADATVHQLPARRHKRPLRRAA